jgi:hypothetical protein
MAKAKGIDLFEHADKIRKSWNRGQRSIILDGRRFTIRLQVHKYKDPETQQRRTEKWLSVSPMDGGILPVANIELKHLGNLRSVQR